MQNIKISDADKSKIVGPYFRKMKEVVEKVQNLNIPFEPLKLKNGNLRLFLNIKDRKNVEVENLPIIEEKLSRTMKYHENLQQKRADKHKDMPYIRQIYYQGYESDYYLDQQEQYFNKNRKNYPYLDQIFKKNEYVSAYTLYNFAVNCMTRGFSEVRKNEKLEFQNSNRLIKIEKEQVAILKGRITPSTKKIKTILEEKLKVFQENKALVLSCDSKTPDNMDSKKMWGIFCRQFGVTVDADKMFSIDTIEELFIVARNLKIDLSNNVEKKAIIKNPKKAAVLKNNALKETTSEMAKSFVDESKITVSESSQTSQLKFILDGENFGKIVEKGKTSDEFSK